MNPATPNTERTNDRANPATSAMPSHYSADDIAIIRAAEKWMRAKDYGQAALGRLARVNASTLNQILKGSYATSPTKQLLAVMSAMRHADEVASNVVQAVETSVFKLAATACNMARETRNFSVLSAFVGTGKTFALKHYAKHHPNTHLLEATPTMTASSLIRHLAAEVAGITGKGSVDSLFSAVIAELRNTDSLLIVDEAETLTAKQLHVLRRVRDLAGIGIVLAGTEHLNGLIKPAHGQFDQIRSRTGFWPEVLQGINPDDAAALCQAGFPQDELSDEFIAVMVAFSRGSARMLVEGLIKAITKFRRGRDLTPALVKDVASKALSLQAA